MITTTRTRSAPRPYFMGIAASSLPRSHGNQLLSIVLGALVVLLFVGLMLGRAAGDDNPPRAYDAPLGLYRVQLPKGVHTLAMPLVPSDATDPAEVFGTSLEAIDLLESWDPTTFSFVPCYSKIPAVVPPDRTPIGPVVRISLSGAAEIRLRGTPNARPWADAVRDAWRSGYFGTCTTSPITLGELYGALGQDSSFVRGRDALFFFDVTSGRWVDLADRPDSFRLPQDTALCAPGVLPATEPGGPETSAPSGPPGHHTLGQQSHHGPPVGSRQGRGAAAGRGPRLLRHGGP
ncbi:MAG: hypothetical protein HY815_17270 [Candidatus Riflebacteria bacterium]|nr:hypothetical protein [Candidatus Riflebacteria bacterium]